MKKNKKKTEKPKYCENGNVLPCMAKATEIKEFENETCKKCYYYNKASESL